MLRISRSLLRPKPGSLQVVKRTLFEWVDDF